MTMIFNIMTLDLSELKTIDFIYFYFISHFILFLLDLGLNISITLHITVKSCLSYASLPVQNNISAVKLPLNHTSPPSTAATLLTTCLMAVQQPSGYSVFHGRDTPIQLSLP